VSNDVTFGSLGGVLALSGDIVGTVSGFADANSYLDLKEINSAEARASFSGSASSGILSVTDGTHTVKVKLEGDFIGSTFSVSSDGAGGTLVTDPPSAARLAAAMANMSASPGSSTLATQHEPPQSVLASPIVT
jgi:hypothetical protein